MFSPLVFFVALALHCLATAFPLSDLFIASSDNISIFATQLLSLRGDGTYLALIYSTGPINQVALNSRVRTIPFVSQSPAQARPATTIVARIRPANNSVAWAYAIDEFVSPAYAVVDNARSIFVVGDSSFTSPDFGAGFRVLRFAVEGEVIWRKLYTHKDLGRPGGKIAFTGSQFGVPYVDFAGPHTLAIVGTARLDDAGPGRSAVFVDTITRKAREARFPLPDGPLEFAGSAGVAADPASGAACFADVTNVESAPRAHRLFVQCANAEGGGEVVSRVLIPFQANKTSISLHMIIASGGEGKAAALYVVAIRSIIYDDTSTGSEKSTDVNEMLLFKLDITTLQDVEWESGLRSMRPTMRKLLLTTSFDGYGNSVTSLDYIRERNTLVVLYDSGTILYGIKTLGDGTIAFRGNSSMAAERSLPGRKWLLYFGDDPEPAAVRIPDDPRPDGEQDDFDFLNIADLELSEDGRGLYLFGGLQTFDYTRFGELTAVLFPIPDFAQPGGGDPEMEAGLREGIGKSLEPSSGETAEVIIDEESNSSPSRLQEQDA